MSGSAPPPTTPPSLDALDLVLVTARLRLRPLQEADVEDLWPCVSDPELPRYMSWAAHTDRSETLGYIRAAQAELAAGTGVTWAIEHAGRVIGATSLHALQRQLRAWRVDRAELGYWIAPAAWGQGLVTEVAHAVVSAGFETLGLHKITVGCLVENAASRRVIEKLNFRPVGRHEDDVWRDGRWWSVLRYELTRAEWSDVSTTIRVSRPHPT
jgi:RimJ/RimL family protein N-acetyltransferase